MFAQIKDVIEHEILEPIRELTYAVIFGSKKVTPIYSVYGLLTGIQFFIIMAILGIFYSIFGYFHNALLTYMAGLILFYAVLISAQKRCRDFGSSGTFWILVISIVFISDMSLHFIDIPTASTFIKKASLFISEIQIVVFFLLCVIPSKPKPDLKLRSPLLKHPLLYTIICGMFAILATMAVNHFAGN